MSDRDRAELIGNIDDLIKLIDDISTARERLGKANAERAVILDSWIKSSCERFAIPYYAAPEGPKEIGFGEKRTCAYYGFTRIPCNPAWGELAFISIPFFDAWEGAMRALRATSQAMATAAPGEQFINPDEMAARQPALDLHRPPITSPEKLLQEAKNRRNQKGVTDGEPAPLYLAAADLPWFWKSMAAIGGTVPEMPGFLNRNWRAFVPFLSDGYKLEGFGVADVFNAYGLVMRFCEVRIKAKAGAPGDASGDSPPAESTDWKSVLAAVDESNLAIINIASDATKTTDQKMRAIYAIDNRVIGWDSPKWASVLQVSEGAIRKADWWKEDRLRLRG